MMEIFLKKLQQQLGLTHFTIELTNLRGKDVNDIETGYFVIYIDTNKPIRSNVFTITNKLLSIKKQEINMFSQNQEESFQYLIANILTEKVICDCKTICDTEKISLPQNNELG